MDTTRTTLAVSVALALATVQGFVLLPCGLDRSHFSARYNGRSHNSAPSCGNLAVGFANPPSASARSSFTRCTSLPRIPCSVPSHSRSRPGGDYFTVVRSSSRCCRPIGAGATTMGLTSRLLVPGAGRKLAFAGLVNAAAFATVGGGVLSGGLHAVSGPDHLAALLPRIMGQKWYSSMRIGATWGLGHGFSATIIGLAAFFFKGRLGLSQNERLVNLMGTWTEGLVGVSLVAIGALGLKESLVDYDVDAEGSFHTEASAPAGAGAVVPRSVGAAGYGVARERGGGRAIFLNGVLHGFSWDGAPSLAPALALSSWASVLWFLLAYCSGTMVAMSATTTLIGEGSVRVGNALHQPDIPRKLSLVSSFVAIGIGALWLAKAMIL